MSVFLPVATYIAVAKVSQYLAAEDDMLKSKKENGSLASASFGNNMRYSRLLQMIRRSVEYTFNIDPTDETLNNTAFYMWSLCARYYVQANNTIVDGAFQAPFIITHPATQTIDSGDNVTFTVLAGGTPTLLYQWYKDGVLMSGETGTSLTLTGVDAGDEADYTVVVTNDSGTVTSNVATLTVTASLLVYWWYGDTDYFTALSGGTDAITYLGSFAIVHNADISVPFPVGAENNKFEVVKVPIGESVKTVWYNTPLNNGTIPDSVFRANITIGSYRYYISRNAMSIDSTQPVVFS